VTEQSEAPVLPLWTLVQTAHLASRCFTEVFAAAGLTPAQFGVLACLADGDDLSKADVARAILLRPQSVARVIDSLIADGLVTREGMGGRGRRAGLRLTETGQAALDQARPAAWAINQPHRLGLSPDQAEQLVGTLEVIRTELARRLGEESLRLSSWEGSR
jgi:DNA-binding MarR family transcriptional regulator